MLTLFSMQNKGNVKIATNFKSLFPAFILHLHIVKLRQGSGKDGQFINFIIIPRGSLARHKSVDH